MQVVTSPELLNKLLGSARKNRNSVGLVPTMGALHSGHASLIQESKIRDEVTVVSIFVNPLQFNNTEDLKKYPRPFDNDRKILAELGVDILYAPSDREMYPNVPIVKINFGEMSESMEGKFRPGHFDGVGLVVAKLINQSNPDRAYFGMKDLQQYLLVKRLVEDLSFSTEIIGMPIIREKSGLAMSSRNSRLSEGGLKIAAKIYEGLKLAEERLEYGLSLNETKSAVFDFYYGIDGLDIEYLEIVDPENLSEYKKLDGNQDVAICVAGYVEGIRLIDNLYLRQD